MIMQIYDIMKKAKLYAIATLVFVVFASGCDSLLDTSPPHFVTTNSLYISLDGFEAGINGMYEMVREERSGRSSNHMIGSQFMGGTDNLVTNHSSGSLFSGIFNSWGDINNPTHGDISANFTWLYSIINSANSIIGHAEQENIDLEGERNRIIAEARAVRAWAYRHLTYGWGDVPLSLEESTGATIQTDWTRAPVEEVRAQIIEDLLFAEEHIPIEASLPGRITKGAVQHYLAEMHLAMGDPDNALSWADEVINNPAYELVTERYGVSSDEPGVPIMDMFQEGNENREQGNTEALWVFQFGLDMVGGGQSYWRRWHAARYGDWSVDGVSALQDTYERGGRGRSRLSLTQWAINLYEDEDDRASNHAIRKYFILKDAEANAPYPADRLPPGYEYGDTLRLDWSEDITPESASRMNWPFSRKVEGTDPNNVGGSAQYNDQVYLRLAETYLLKAEAQYLIGDVEGAAETLNVVRRRSNASEITAGDVDIDFILDERSRELVVEEHRRHTLLRTGKWLERTREHNHNGGQLISDRDTLYPIPQDVIDANLTGDMPQNPGF